MSNFGRVRNISSIFFSFLQVKPIEQQCLAADVHPPIYTHVIRTSSLQYLAQSLKQNTKTVMCKYFRRINWR